MAEQLDEKEVVSFKKALIGQMNQLDAVSQLLIEKGVFTEEEFFSKLKQVRDEYERRKALKG